MRDSKPIVSIKRQITKAVEKLAGGNSRERKRSARGGRRASAKKRDKKDKHHKDKSHSKGRLKGPSFHGNVGSDQTRRIDEMIHHQIDFESRTDNRFKSMMEMMGAFSKAMWERNKEITKITDSVRRNRNAIGKQATLLQNMKHKPYMLIQTPNIDQSKLD